MKKMSLALFVMACLTLPSLSYSQDYSNEIKMLNLFTVVPFIQEARGIAYYENGDIFKSGDVVVDKVSSKNGDLIRIHINKQNGYSCVYDLVEKGTITCSDDRNNGFTINIFSEVSGTVDAALRSMSDENGGYLQKFNFYNKKTKLRVIKNLNELTIEKSNYYLKINGNEIVYTNHYGVNVDTILNQKIINDLYLPQIDKEGNFKWDNYSDWTTVATKLSSGFLDEVDKSFAIGNYPETLRLCLNEHEKGNPRGTFIAAILFDGKFEGVPTDKEKALELFRSAAWRGVAGAQNTLGSVYYNGKGVPQSHEDGYAWWAVGAAFGDSGALSNRDFALRELTPSQIDQGQKIAKQIMVKLNKNGFWPIGNLQ